MVIPESLLILAGFVFAHATWNLSDLPKGDLLAPLAIVERSQQRQLLRFEAETQEEAISQGKTTLKEHENELDAWAFAREGQMQEGGKYIDTLTVEAKAKGMPGSIVFVQRFRPFHTGQFKLIGKPMVVIGAKIVSDAEAEIYLEQLHQGIQSHSQAAELWPKWAYQ